MRQREVHQEEYGTSQESPGIEDRCSSLVSAVNPEQFFMSSLPDSNNDRSEPVMRFRHADVGERAQSLSRAVDRSREQEQRRSDAGTLESGGTQRRAQRGNI